MVELEHLCLGLGHTILLSSDGDLILVHGVGRNVDPSLGLVHDGCHCAAIGSTDEWMVDVFNLNTLKCKLSLKRRWKVLSQK